MADQRTRYSSDFKERLALEALRDQLTAPKLAATETAK